MKKTAFAALMFLCTFPGISSAAVVDLNSLQHGEIINTQFASQGITQIVGNNFNNSQDLVVAFDSSGSGSSDPDLEGPPWATGNLAPNTQLGNLMILQSGTVSQAEINAGVVNNPNDEGQTPSGTITMDFDQVYTSFGYDLLDIESPTQGGSPTHSISFFYNGGLIGTVDSTDYVTNNNPFFDSTIMYGDNSANRIDPITIAELNSFFGTNAVGFDQVQYFFNTSQAVDTFVFTTTVPEPASALLMLGSAFGFGVVRRRRNKKAAAEAC